MQMRMVVLCGGVLLSGCRSKEGDSVMTDTGPDEVVDGAVDEDADGYTALDAGGDDCDDNNSGVNPGAMEICDGIDNNCNGEVDEGVTSVFFADADGDGFGSMSAKIEACTAPSGYVNAGNDCDDADPDTFPGAEERCDGVDNDCDSDIDEDVQSIWYADTDGDSFGDADATLKDCDPPGGYVADDTDCDDTNSSAFPGAKEVCDDVDNDCDTDVDEGVTITYYVDSDADNFGDADATTQACTLPSGHAEQSGDCDDTNGSIYPGAVEYCDEVDNNCDGDIDETSATDALTWYQDGDGDGYGESSINTPSCEQPSGYVADDTDCDDGDGDVYPGAPEYCNETDNDCDGTADNDAVDADVWFIDYDGDDFGSSRYTLSQCDQPTGYVADDTDCDDADGSIYPGAEEACDEVDSDCDGSTDDPESIDAITWYADTDGDGFGDASSTTDACLQPSSYVTDDTDCDDGESTAYPDSTETETPFDGVDTDCDGNDFCTDLNCDGQPDVVFGVYYSGSSHTTSSRLHFNTGGGFDDTDVTTLPTVGTYEADTADVNGDGYIDVVFANYYDGSTRNIDSYIYYGAATGYSSSNRDSLPTVGAVNTEIADVDGDGFGDLLFANYNSDSTYSVDSYIYYGSSTGYSTVNRDGLPGNGAFKITSQDLNDDGYNDIVMCNYYNGSYAVDSYVYYGASTGFSTANRDSLPTLGCRDVQISDLNQDGYTDLIFANYYSGSSHYTSSYIYFGTATGYTTAYRDSLPTVGALSAQVADFDNDGYDDVLFGGYYTGSWSTPATTYIYYNSSLGFSTSIYDSFTVSGVYKATVGDLNDDGYTDVVLPSYYSGSAYATSSVLLYGAVSGFTSTSIETIGASKASVGDLDGDGLPEVVFNNYYTGTWSTLADSYVYYGASSGYDASLRDDLSTAGSWPRPVLVGNTDW